MSDKVGKVSLGLELDQGGIGKQISAIAGRTSARFGQAMKSSIQNVMKGVKASAKSIPVPDVDTTKAKAEIEQLTAVLDNTNAKLDVQHQKLARLKESYNNTFSEPRKNKLQEQII